MKVRIGPYDYTRRDYTPKRRGQEAGHGWVRTVGDGPHRAEVGLEGKLLVDEVVALRSALYDAITSVLDDPRVFGVTLDHETGMASLTGRSSADPLAEARERLVERNAAARSGRNAEP